MPRPAFADLLNQPGRHPFGQSLYLTVKGPASARWEYRFRAGPNTVASMWLGSAIGPGAIALTQARMERNKAWLERRGAVPRKPRGGGTRKAFPEVVTEWLKGAALSWADKTRAGRGRALLRLPLASMDVSKIKTQDVLGSLLSIESARQRDDVRQDLARVLDFAAAHEWMIFGEDGNPAKFDGKRRDMLPKYEKKKDDDGEEINLKAVPWEQLPTVYAALPDSEVGNAVRFDILTAARPGEVEQATWGQVVGENGTSAWIIPAERMKGRKTHRVPLTPAVLKLLGKRGEAGAPLFKLASNAMLNCLQDIAPGMSVHATARSGFKMWGIGTKKDRALIPLSQKVAGDSGENHDI